MGFFIFSEWLITISCDLQTLHLTPFCIQYSLSFIHKIEHNDGCRESAKYRKPQKSGHWLARFTVMGHVQSSSISAPIRNHPTGHALYLATRSLCRYVRQFVVERERESEQTRQFPFSMERGELFKESIPSLHCRGSLNWIRCCHPVGLGDGDGVGVELHTAEIVVSRERGPIVLARMGRGSVETEFDNRENWEWEFRKSQCRLLGWVVLNAGKWYANSARVEVPVVAVCLGIRVRPKLVHVPYFCLSFRCWYLKVQ